MPHDAPSGPPDRRGLPSPLLVHLAAAASSYGQAITLAPLAEDPRFPWTADAKEAGRAAGRMMRSGEDGAANGGGGGGRRPDSLPEAIDVALESAARLKQMIRGIERYQGHPHARRLVDPPAIWRAGAARLLDYGQAPEATDPQGPVLLAIPSLVNRAYVLDLHPQRSLMRHLASQGFRPLLLDWGDPGTSERGFALDDYWRRRLLPAAEAAVALNRDAPPALLGYCMGGAFAAALAARRPALAGRMALIGAPWDFARMQGLGAALHALAQRGEAPAVGARLEGLGEMLGAVPVDVLQLMFALLDPTLALRKFRRFADLPDGLAAELFVATEDWLNDGVALAAPTAVDLAVGWYMDNLTARGEWLIAGEPVVAEAIGVPTLAFCSASDRIAPPPCAEALPKAIPGARIRRPRTGHVGMIIGSSAPDLVWSPLARFLSEV